MTAYHQFQDRLHPDGYRRAQVQALIQALRARENRLLITVPGMGVSNLLRFFVARPALLGLPASIVYINCNELGETLHPERLFAEVARQFEDQGLVLPPDGATHGYDQLRLIVRHALSNAALRLIMVIDQTDALWPQVSAPFFRQLKALTDANKHVCIVVAAALRDVHLIDPEDLLFAQRELYVGPLSAADFAHAVNEEAQRLETVFSVAIKQKLARLTGCHPGLLRAVSSAVVQDWPKGNDEAIISQLMARKDVTYRCRKLWQGLTPLQQNVLQKVAIGVNDRNVAPATERLRQLGILEQRPDDGQLHFCSSLLAAFVAAQEGHRPLIRLEPSATIVVDDRSIIVAGKVYKGNKEVDVTPLQLKFIACLLGLGSIVPRRTLLDYVYHDEYVDETDTRLDNLVRQVRQRLGQEHIKVHRGQGYELLGGSETAA
jgi:hypothetical protein